VTKVPPAGTPAVGLTAVTVGHTLNTNWSAELVALVPAGVVTVMSTVPWASAGEMAAVIEVPEVTVKPVAALAPKLTAVAALKFAPVMATEVPPVVYPLVGVTMVTIGALSKINLSAGLVALVPDGATTVTSTVPAVSDGELTVIRVAEVIVKVPAAVVPNHTAVALPK
jgi:hypothetical protein